MPNPTDFQPITDRIRGSIADYVEGEITRGIKRQADIAADFPGFLADPNPAPVNQRFAKGIVRQVCRAWARGGTPIQGALADAVYGPLCTPYLATINESPTTGGGFARPFLGGQCEGAIYRITCGWTGTIVFCSGGNSPGSGPAVERPVDLVGPIKGFAANLTVNSPCGPSRFLDCRVFHGPNPGQFTDIFITNTGTTSRFENASITGFSVRRIGSGVTDNCGDPPIAYLPPQTRPLLPTLPPFVPSDGPLGGQPINVGFDADGNVNVSIPGLGVDVTVPNPLRDDEPADELPPGEQGTAGEEGAETGTGDEGEDETRNLVGVLVRLRNIPPRANALFNQDGTVYKGACFVYFGGAAGLTLNPDALFCRQEQFFYAPKGCNRWRVVPNVGYTLTVQPFYED